MADTNDVAYQHEIIDSLMRATEGRSDLKPPARWGEVYNKLSTNEDPQMVAKADVLAARLGDDAISWRKQEIVLDAFAPMQSRLAALQLLLDRRDFQLTPIYQKILPEPALRLSALRGLAAYDVATTPAAILALYSTFNDTEKRAALSVLSARPAYAAKLIEAVRNGVIPKGDVDATVIRQLGLLQDPEITRATAELWGVVRESPEAAAKEIAHWKKILTPEKLAAANPSRGRAKFLQSCALCHTLFDDGQHIGPELTGSNRADLDYLLVNILDPNAVIGKDYLLTTVETKDGRTAAGILQRETASTVTLVNQVESVTLPRDSIKSSSQLELSLMPPGLLHGMSEDEVADLIAYLRSSSQVPLPQ
ncbi:MAG: c-type cytochrome [Opitutus sp.]|nr:c-type cytochrome [Opitutus sp.]